MRLIFKFGGSSLSTHTKIMQVANFIKQTKSRKDLDLIVVVSAMGNTTNKLTCLAETISKNKNSESFSSILSLGENLSTHLLSLALNEIDCDAIGLTSKDVKIYAQGLPSQAIITHIEKSLIEKHLQNNKVVIISGFQGENLNNQTLTLGRGGSDTTAVALGKIFDAPVKIFTDVKGFYSLNPKEYNSCQFLKSINIYSAIELSNISAKVLDFRCLCLANKSKNKLTVLESTSTSGTTINYDCVESYKIDGISTKTKVLFAKNTSKKTLFLQNIILNSNIKTYFYENNQGELCAFSNENKILTPIINTNYLKIKTKFADLLILTGSGLCFFKEFIKKVQKVIKENKINVLFFNLSQTKLTILTKTNQGKLLEEKLALEFNLIKEKL